MALRAVPDYGQLNAQSTGAIAPARLTPPLRADSVTRVKTEAPQPRPRYRNEVVFRSAQRLLASRPKPRRPLPSRWVVFFLGLACGLGLVFWLTPPRDTAATAKHAATQSDAAITAGAVVRPKAPAPPVAHPVALVTTPASADPAAPPPPIALAEQPLVAEAQQALEALRPSLPTPLVTPNISATRAPVVGVSYRIFSSALRLRGEMRVGTTVSRKVEMLLFLFPGTNSVAGAARIIDGAGQTEPFQLNGMWSLDLVTLIEERARGYRFTVKFPTTASGAFTGTWRDGTGVSGTLSLQSVPRF